MLRQPWRQTADSFSQRLSSPVSSTSSASAKLDFPLPLRPTTEALYQGERLAYRQDRAGPDPFERGDMSDVKVSHVNHLEPFEFR